MDEKVTLWVWNRISEEGYVPSRHVANALRLLKAAKPRAYAALVMRADGATYSQIGEALGVSRQRAKQVCDKAILTVTKLSAIQKTLGSIELPEERCS